MSSPQLYCCDWILCLRLEALVCSQWTGLVCVFSLFCSHSMFHFHEKKQKVWVSDTWLIDDKWWKLHFWGGANIVGPIFVIVHLLAPVTSLNGSSPCGLTVRLVWARVGDTAPVFYLQEIKMTEKGRLRYWRMCFWETWGTHFEFSTWKQYIVHLASWQEIKIKSGIILLVIQCFFSTLLFLSRSLEFAR